MDHFFNVKIINLTVFSPANLPAYTSDENYLP